MKKAHVRSRSKKVLVTGAAGFIGFHVAEMLLKQGTKVWGVDIVNTYYDPRIKQKRLAILKKYKNFTFVRLDLSDFKKTFALIKKIRPDEIIHLAAQAGVRFSLTDPWAYIRNNELATLNIFESARLLTLPRVLYASSSSVYGGNRESPMRESDRTDKPLAVYGVTKRSNELLAHAYHNLYHTELIGLRFFTVYGIWGRPDLALFKFTKNISAGKPIDVYNHGKMKRSFTHISDITAGISALLETKPSYKNEVYNLGGAKPVALNAFISLIEREVGKKAMRRELPMQAGDVSETVADCNKAQKDFGYVARTTIEEGVRDFVAWFKKHESFLRNLKAPKQ